MVAAGAAFVALGVLVPSFRRTNNSVLFNSMGYSLLVLTMTGMIAYFMLPRRNVLYRLLSFSPLVYLGTISYSLYLTHKIINHLFYMNGFRHWQVAVAGLAGTVLWSTISWYGMGKPLQRFKGRYRSRVRRPRT